MSGFYSRMGWYDSEGNLMVGCAVAGVVALLVVAGVIWLVVR